VFLVVGLLIVIKSHRTRDGKIIYVSGSAPAPDAVRRASRRTSGGRGVHQNTRGRVCSPASISLLKFAFVTFILLSKIYSHLRRENSVHPKSRFQLGDDSLVLRPFGGHVQAPVSFFFLLVIKHFIGPPDGFP
jgi:hypothetical protein